MHISFQGHLHAQSGINMSGRPECSKKPVQQGRSLFGARSVLPVREHGKKARTPLADFFNIPYEEDQPNLEGTNNRSGTKQQRWTKDYIKRTFWPSIYSKSSPFIDKFYVKATHFPSSPTFVIGSPSSPVRHSCGHWQESIPSSSSTSLIEDPFFSCHSLQW